MRPEVPFQGRVRRQEVAKTVILGYRVLGPVHFVSKTQTGVTPDKRHLSSFKGPHQNVETLFNSTESTLQSYKGRHRISRWRGVDYSYTRPLQRCPGLVSVVRRVSSATVLLLVPPVRRHSRSGQEPRKFDCIENLTNNCPTIRQWF